MKKIGPSLGEQRMRISFEHPSDSSNERIIKEHTAYFINHINETVTTTEPEGHRLKALALTHIEESAMWAVKAVTI